MDMLQNLQHEVRLHYDAFLIGTGVETPQRSPADAKRPRNYALDSITDELDSNYYRIQFDSVLESMSRTDFLQLCNHWIVNCLWNACGEDREKIPTREESDKVLLKTQFKDLHADKVKMAQHSPRAPCKCTVFKHGGNDASRGLLLHSAKRIFIGHIFIVLRTYPMSEVWCRSWDLLVNAGYRSQMTIDE